MDGDPRNKRVEELNEAFRRVPTAVGSSAIRGKFLEETAVITQGLDGAQTDIDAVLAENETAMKDIT